MLRSLRYQFPFRLHAAKRYCIESSRFHQHLPYVPHLFTGVERSIPVAAFVSLHCIYSWVVLPIGSVPMCLTLGREKGW